MGGPTMQQNIAAVAIASLAAWDLVKAAQAAEAQVINSSAACKSPSTAERLEVLERRNDDQAYKQLYLRTSESRGKWVCVRSSETSPCFWTPAKAIQDRQEPLAISGGRLPRDRRSIPSLPSLA